MKVATIIVSYNGAAFIEKCLTSVSESFPFEHKIFLIDNASTDNTVALVETHFPLVEIIHESKNAGFGQANNQGLRKALDWGAEYFFLLNQDAWIEPGGLTKIIEISTKNKDFGILSPLHLNGHRTGFDHGFIQHIARNGAQQALLFDLLNNTQKEIYQVEFVNAAAWLLTRQCVEKVGGFAPIFFHYGEDDNYVHRVVYHGFKVGVCPEIKAVHSRHSKPAQQDFEFFWRSYLIDILNVNKSFGPMYAQYKRHNAQRLLMSIVRLNINRALMHLKLIREARAFKKTHEATRHLTESHTPLLFL